ncbi:MAG: polar amino acid ABC transporter permease [Burkholderiales bacterium PBB3]|nr:MAG: polar amino acid ABC transporter permease [Burkholderiales bacterium PBB3]
MMDVAAFLLTWTPFLAVGFLWNVGVTILAVAIGTCVGVGLARLRLSNTKALVTLSGFLSRAFRNVPTLALLFFAVFVLPKEFTVYGTSLVVEIPLWFKAALGLSGSVIGFASESLVLAHQNLKRHDYGAAMLFIPTWGSSVMISFIASSTASLVGVSELISRSNSIIAATGTGHLIPVYLYCALFFMAGCLLWMALINRIKSSPVLLSMLKRAAG